MERNRALLFINPSAFSVMGTGPFLALLLKLTDVSIMRRRRSDATAGVVKTVTESLAASNPSFNGFNRTLWVLCIVCVVFWFIYYDVDCV